MSFYQDMHNPDLLDRIPLAARTVLDVGCATGALGARFKTMNPSARVYGIDNDPRAAAIAATRLDAVACVDVEDQPFPFAVDRPIDCLVYGDVLEHLRDPWGLVAKHVDHLAPDGTLLICLPNVEHWSFAARLLQGNWQYEDSGLFDRTHLRWFTIDTIGTALAELGLHPCDIAPRIFDADRAERFVATIGPALADLGVTPEAYRLRATPLQYVWRVRRAPRRLLTVAANMLKPVGGVSHTRVIYPLRALSTDPTVSVRLVTDRVETTAPDADKIFVLHRPVLVGDDGARTLHALRADGWLVVTEFDDHPDHFPAMRVPDVLTFAGVHAVQTSTEALATVLRERNPEVAVFRNAIFQLPDVINFARDDRLTLFFGALNREHDWAEYMPALNEVLAAVGDRLHVSVVHDQAFFDALQTPNKVFEPTTDHDRYMALLGGCEIAFMPLADTAFNRAKSDLKFIEAGACRVAPLASRVVYGDSARDEETAMLFDTPETMRQKLLRLVAIPGLARAVADRARAYVAAERMFAYQVADRVAWYRDLMTRRDALGEALDARLAAILPPVGLANASSMELAASDEG